jgi:hypothetical protein
LPRYQRTSTIRTSGSSIRAASSSGLIRLMRGVWQPVRRS